ncbi:glycosyl transferase [Salipaludibacillus keqinensis]|uniref:Glycosyl transferase n=1 Tax=Salipaludibacillus keqinensis TaxID=2045207 RepID=A0A323TJM2_9BACI|nr:glycosyltransferase [Salipaludibacillus keqinensis]PYZ95078.1 glycosyl transferase [Salipaludibacillus keqinensis]
MKKLLFIIDSLCIGGAEKSLVTLLNQIDFQKYQIDLMILSGKGDLINLLPKQVNLIQPPKYFQFLKERKGSNKQFLFKCYRIKTSVNLRLNNLKSKPLHTEQVVYANIKRLIKPLSKVYDVAIAYSQGMPTYYVSDKISARKKLAWVNTDYVNTLYDKELDFESYKKIDRIVTVSNNTNNSMANLRPEYKYKTHLIKDIIDPAIIIKLANKFIVPEYGHSELNILSVGRLDKVKSYDKAVKVAKLLSDKSVKFKWFIIGEGPDRQRIEKYINDYKLNENIKLLGKKSNPYPYMKHCDIYVQTSIKEGFGLTICEAKILKRPIVCTNFPTAKEIINNEIDGLIVEHNIESIFTGVLRFIEDSNFAMNINDNLIRQKPYSSIDQIEKFYALTEG